LLKKIDREELVGKGWMDPKLIAAEAPTLSNKKKFLENSKKKFQMFL
jgi:hypothetical protein